MSLGDAGSAVFAYVHQRVCLSHGHYQHEVPTDWRATTQASGYSVQDLLQTGIYIFFMSKYTLWIILNFTLKITIFHQQNKIFHQN